ncbi:MAG: DNA polymerase III subunit gamma/tau [Marinilabiliales bacterium]|nr:MAG: DNA polymerase III subunit gamma/tau [Marinilabiliales bacterium]
MEKFIISARKYRPATFKQVVGQDAITSTLQNAIKNQHLAQAFLFTGPRGVGKTTCTRILAKTINCKKLKENLEPCDQCESCTSFNNNASFNIHELDAASNNSVDDIRNLVDQVRIPPQVGLYKVYIIDEVHMLSPAAFNAFLKTLEEPPAYAKFILATTEKHKIIPTILSRCQIFDFRRISVEDIADYLSYVARNEKIDAEIEALHIIAQKADGALRDALSTFDQIVSYSGDTLTYKNVIENLNILDYEYYFRVSEAILHAEISELLLIFNEIIENGFDGQHFITGLTEHLRNLLIIKDPATLQLLLASPSLKEKYKAQSEQFDAITLLKAIDTCNKYDLSYKTSNNKRLHVEIALMQLSQIEVSESTPQIKKAAASDPKTVNEPVKEYKKPVEKQTEPKEEIAVVKEKKVVSKTRKEENGRKVKNISIKDSLNTLKQTKDPKLDKPEATIITEFNQESLLKVWNDFIESYQNKAPSFANAIAKYPPQLRDNFVIEYMVDNQIVAGDLLNITSMLEFLKKELNNNQITLKPVVAEKSSQKTAYTDREKFEEMAKKYPGLIDLKEQLNLELDF